LKVLTIMLHFDGAWRFDTPGPIADGVLDAFEELIRKIVAQGNRQNLLEHFKSHFAGAAGVPHYVSSSASWAESDLQGLVRQAAGNAPLFIEAFYNACEELRARNPQMGLPDAARLNRILIENTAGYEIRPPNLVATRQHSAIAVPERAASLTEQAQEIIQTSLQASDGLLAEGRNRRAVQEILWLLETVATAFRGISTEDGTVQGGYFNKIVADLRSIGRGKSLEQILGWVMALHGYLSAPKGGGIRHGVDLKEGVAVQANEARLYCNLIRSYITFLIVEHEHLSRR
jgi:hypothetical protein